LEHWAGDCGRTTTGARASSLWRKPDSHALETSDSRVWTRIFSAPIRDFSAVVSDFPNSALTECGIELGNGFSFVARQKRIILDGDEFKIDLVFYNRLLQCFVLFDIKTDKITHQDLGQLQMYVNYYDRDIKSDFENPTIGVLLCADKNDTVVRYSLPENNQQILASKYQLHLPTEQQLAAELRKELDRWEQENPNPNTLSHNS